MKHLWLLGLLCLGCAGATPEAHTPKAAAAEKSERKVFMFAVDREGSPRAYLHGSVHVMAEGRNTAEPVIDDAFAQADALVVELDVVKVDQQAIHALTVQLGFYPEGDDITKHISPEAWQALLPVLAKLELPAENMKKLKPWLLALTMTMVNLQRAGYSGNAGIDMRFLTAAHDEKAPREVISLETMDEQLQALASMSDDIQTLFLNDSVKQLDDTTYFESLTDAWRAGDVDKLAEIMFRSLRDEPRLAPMYETLFFARNRRMAERLARMLEQPKRYFVVVGAGHLAGPQSVPELLRARGFTVTQVTAPSQ